VEIHGAIGYLVNQFINSSNNRTEIYGGSVDKRDRFALEVIDAAVAAVGEEHTAIRFLPEGGFQDIASDNVEKIVGLLGVRVAREPSWISLFAFHRISRRLANA